MLGGSTFPDESPGSRGTREQARLFFPLHRAILPADGSLFLS
jgi:hypothetical protein